MSRLLLSKNCAGHTGWILLAAMIVALVLPGHGHASELPSLGENSLFNIERETRLGRTVYDRLLARNLIETQPLLDRYINDLGQRLLAVLDDRVREYRFFIIRDDAVNAFALPGGFIGINRGLIMQARTQHQLASVLAHEIAHVKLTHGLDMMRKGREIGNAAILALLAGLLLGGGSSDVGAAMVVGSAAGSQQAIVNFTRDNEYEADRLGMDLLKRAGFDPVGMVEFFRIMTQLSGSSEIGDIEYLRTHPVGSNRVAEAAARAGNLAAGENQVDNYLLFKDFLQYSSTDHLTASGSEYLEALSLIQSADYPAANEILEKLYQSDNENIWYSIAFAENLEHLDQNSQAELVYRRLLDIFPGDYALSMRLLRLLRKSGQNQSALVIARGIEIGFPEDQQIYFELSELYEALGRPAMRLMAEAEFHRLRGNSKQAIKLYDQVLKSVEVDLATESKAREKRLLLLQ